MSAAPVREGSAEVLSPYAHAPAGPSADGKQDVFYNPAQVFNRDFSVLVLNTFSKLWQFEEAERARDRAEKHRRRLAQDPSAKAPAPASGEGLCVLEALGASGLRSVRYWKEVENVHRIVCNDLDPTAVEHMRRNLAHNKVPEPDDAGRGVRANQSDAILHMYANVGVYDVIDLDPYGTASPFLDAALKSVRTGGLLCVTSTDMPILGGNHPETCFYRYGGTALKARYVHEMSLRLLMNAIQSTAARHQRYVEPLISVSIDFYVRVFVRVYDGASRAKALGSCTGLVYQCTQCDSFAIQPMGDIVEDSEKSKKRQKDKGSQHPAAAAKAAEAAVPAQPNDACETSPSEVRRAAYVALPCNKFCFSSGVSSPAMLRAMAALAGASDDEVAGAGGNAQASTAPKYRVARGREAIGAYCGECEGRWNLGGPLYLGSLYNKDFIRLCLGVCEQEALEHVVSWKKITGLLTAMDEEIESIPLHYDLPNICSSLKLQTIPLKQFRGILRSLGYQVSHFHREPNSIKTDAPSSVMYDILRKWALHKTSRNEGNADKQTTDIKRGEKRGSVPSHISVILGRPPQAGDDDWEQRLRSIDFERTCYAAQDECEERPRKVARFLPNPEKNWGPKPRAKPLRETPPEAAPEGAAGPSS